MWIGVLIALLITDFNDSCDLSVIQCYNETRQLMLLLYHDSKRCFQTLLRTLSNLHQLQTFFTAGMRIKLPTKLLEYFPPHLRRVAVLPCEIKNAKLSENVLTMQ